jgi:hypothetical protein
VRREGKKNELAETVLDRGARKGDISNIETIE